MKLKIILMPVSVIISIVLIIWHIYPAWFGVEADSIKSTRTEIKKIETDINDIKNKKNNAQKLSQSLSENEDIRLLINKYYPTFRNDEDMVNNINKVAFAEGVFLSGMDVEYKNMDQMDNPVALMSLPFDESKYANMKTLLPDGSFLTGTSIDGVPLGELAKKKIKYVKSNLEIYGTYEQIKKFISSLNRLGLLNKIQLFDVHKKDSAQIPNIDDSNQIDIESVLFADLEIGFGYLIAKNEDVGSLLNENIFVSGSFNFDSANKNKDSLIGNYKQSEVGETGSINPFAAEITE